MPNRGLRPRRQNSGSRAGFRGHGKGRIVRTALSLRRLFVSTLFALPALSVMAEPAAAMDVGVTPISFGRVAIVDSTSTQSIELTPEGQMIPSSGILVVMPGTPAVLSVYGAPANTSLSLDFTANPIQWTAGGEAFTIQDWNGDGGAVTNSNGELTMRLGATLVSQAGASYPDHFYYGGVALTIDY